MSLLTLGVVISQLKGVLPLLVSCPSRLRYPAIPVTTASSGPHLPGKPLVPLHCSASVSYLTP